jgi:hypothetical protein
MTIYSSTFAERLQDSWDRQQTLIEGNVLTSLLTVAGFEPIEYNRPSRMDDISGIDLWVSTPASAVPVALRDKGTSSLKYNDFTMTKTLRSGREGEFWTSRASLYVFTYWQEDKPVLARLVNMFLFLPAAREGQIAHKESRNNRNGQTFAAFDWDLMDPYIMSTWRSKDDRTGSGLVSWDY